MATTSPDNIRTPDPGDAYNLVPDLANMANDVQAALSERTAATQNQVDAGAINNRFVTPLTLRREVRNFTLTPVQAYTSPYLIGSFAVGRVCHLNARLILTNTLTGDAVATVPVGFRISGSTVAAGVAMSSAGAVMTVAVNATGGLYLTNASAPVLAGHAVSISASWLIA